MSVVTLPAASAATGSGVTEGQFKAFIEQQRAFIAQLLGEDGLAATARSALGIVGPMGTFYKADPTSVAFTKNSVNTASIKAGTYVFIGATLVSFSAATAITMPTLTSGTDYAIWAKDDGTLQATTSFTSAPGSGNYRKIGGFHYAPGGHSGSSGGGNSTPQINEYSFWDLQWRPACADPRGMACIAGGFWRDIYLLNTNPDVNGTSKYNVTIADGSSPPKIPALVGGNGSTDYGSLTWFEAARIAGCYGKRLLTLDEQIISSYGTTEQSSIGTDQGSTIWNAAYVSKFGINQCSGVMWYWLANRGGPYESSGSWQANTEGFGSTVYSPNAALGGGDWADGSNCGSCCSYWSNAASRSANNIGASLGCDHLNLAV